MLATVDRIGLTQFQFCVTLCAQSGVLRLNFFTVSGGFSAVSKGGSYVENSRAIRRKSPL